MIYGAEATLTVSGSAVIAADNLPKKIPELTPISSYHVWEGSNHFLSISDIVSFVGVAGVTVGISMAIYRIYKDMK